MDTTASIIRILRLVKRYHHQPVLDHLTFNLAKSEFCVLVGANGAGKTTLLRILASLNRPDAGKIWVDNTLMPGSPQIRRLFGYVGHQTMFYQDLNAVENLSHYARLYHLENSKKLIIEGLRSAGLEKYQSKPVRTFSRGMQQRLSIARALLHEPSILLLDEPHTGLDHESALRFDRLLSDLNQRGCTILMAAHQPQRLLPIATHLAWLNEGKIEQHLPVTDIIKHPHLHQFLRESL